MVACAVEHKRAHVDRLTWLIDGFLCGEQNRCSVFERNGLRIFRRSNGCVGDETDLVLAGQACRQMELRGKRAAMVEASGEEQAGLLVANKEFGADRAGKRGVVIAGIRDKDAHRRIAAGNVFALAKNTNDRAAQNPRNGFDAFDSGDVLITVLESITQPLPHKVFKGDGCGRRDDLLPRASAFGDANCALCASENVFLGIEDLRDELARTLPGGVVWNRDKQIAMCKCGSG